AVRHGLAPPVPALDPRPLLTMDDMGHGGMDHGAMGHGSMDHAAMDHAAMGHAAHGTRDGQDGHAGPAGHDDHAGHGAMAGHGDAMQRHPVSEDGNPLVDMQAMVLSPKLDDPGVGLRGNGRTVLTYAAMHSLFDDPDGREPGRDDELHLTGHMATFAWSF